MSAEAATAERVVIDDVWTAFERRGDALRAESRAELDTRRRRALTIDGLLLTPPSLACFLLIEDAWAARVLALALALSYFFVCEALSGQTLGKRRMRLRVVRLDGRPLTVASAATRNVLLPVDTFALCLVGYLVMLASGRRQRICDLLAGPVVTSAAEHRHLPAHERGRSAMVAGYPIAWIATAVVAVSLPA